MRSPRGVALWRRPELRAKRLVALPLPRRGMAVPRGDKAAKRDPADHCRKDEPKFGVNSSINSHVALHGRP